MIPATPQQYSNTAEQLVQRILDLAERRPEVLSLDNPFDLFHYGLKCDDLSPSLYQAQWAIQQAKIRYKERKS